MKKLSIFLSTVFCSVVLFRSIGGMEKSESTESYDEKIKAILQREIDGVRERNNRIAQRISAERNLSNRIREIDQLINDPAISQNERARLVQEQQAVRETLDLMERTLHY